MDTKPILTIFHGLPGSGKSTEAEKMAERERAVGRNTFVVNRDSIRTELFGEEYHSGNFPKGKEKQVLDLRDHRISAGLKAGSHVISDDTNLNNATIEKLVALAAEHGAEVRQVHMDVEVDEAKRRNRVRGEAGGRMVDEKVIDRMARFGYGRDGRIRDFVISSTGKVYGVHRSTAGAELVDEFNRELEVKYPVRDGVVVLLDLDGTLANNSKVTDMAFGTGKKDFKMFYRDSEFSPVNENVLNLVRQMYADGATIIALTGRDHAAAGATVRFLGTHNPPISRLIMKRQGDFRRDVEFKREMLNRLRNEFDNVAHAIDDRVQVVDMWREEGLTVSVVPEHIPVHPDESPDEYPSKEVITVWKLGSCFRCGGKRGSELLCGNC